MRRLDFARFLLPIAPKLAKVEGALMEMLRSDVPVVEKLAAHVRAGKGKRLRPALVLMGSRLCGVDSDEDARFGAIFELVHTATLVHDDVIDHAQTRRGRPTLNTLWGNTLTVLFGDLLYLHGMSAAIQARSFRMLEILASVTTRMIEGELIQEHVLYDLGTTRQAYFDILERKTALLFSGCAETGAVLAARPEADALALRRFGLEIGRAFQLVDDLLDYTATSEALGKPAFTDLREGKLTLPLLTLLERAPEEASALVRTLWDLPAGEPVPPALEASLRGLLVREDALAETRDLARKASLAAREALAPVAGDKSARRLLLDIPDMLLERGS